MTDLSHPPTELTPERRRLLELRLRARQAQAAGPELRPVPRPDGTAPLSASQRRLWVMERMEPGGGAYTASFAVRVRGPLDEAALRRALDTVVARHETLRTTFAERDGVPVQVIHPPAPVALRHLDLSHLAAGEREAALRERGDADAGAGFDIEAGPVFRVTLARLGDEEHALLFAMHHIVTDGWSFGVLARELGEAYAAWRQGREPELPPLAVQYADFAAWEHERLRGGALERLAAFWRGALEGAPPALELPADHPRPARASHRGGLVRARIEPTLAARLRELARAEDATLFHVLVAAFRVVLARHAGEDDVVIGTPVANRPRSALEGLIGFFVNTVPLRGRIGPAESFAARVRAEKAAALAAFQHADLPFDRMVEELRLPRDPSRNPVFQAALTLQNARMDPLALAGCEVTPLDTEHGTTRFDLTLDNWQDDDGGVSIHAEYAAALFAPRTIERIVARFVGLLQAAAETPDAPVAALAAVSPEERRALLRLSAGPELPRDPAATLTALFESQAARTPGAVAVSFAGSSLTYAELDAAANRIAHLIRARGAGMETPVAVVMERSLEMVAALHGVLKAGAFYVPIDPELPPERLAWMLGDAAPRVTLTQRRWLDRLPPPAPAVALDDPAALAGFPADPVAGRPDPDALAYVIYTSGSTGRPKGAGNTHRAVANRILWMQETFGLDAGDVVLQKTPFTFDVSVWEFFWPLMAGARLAVAAPGAHREPRRLSDAVRAEGVTTLHFVPSMLQAWLDDGSPAGCTSLRRVMSSGEALSAAARDRFAAVLPAAELHNLYGPTEAAVDVTWQDVRAAGGGASVPIGRPIANTRTYVLDAGDGLCPPGVPGELHIAGVQVGRGYRGRPALTAERFVPDPFAAEPGSRMYRTGDRTRWIEAGAGSEPALEYLGRLDFQVKVRGFRVEPGEVEAALRAHPAVADCVVAARPDASGAARLVAYVVPAGGPMRADELRAHLAARLPEPMVPAAFVALDAIPLTPSGKVDRRVLPEPEVAAETGYVAPETADEAAVAEIWAELLGAARVGVNDDFVSLGGHSLLGVRVVSRIAARLGVELPLRAVFEAPTVRALARRVAEARAEGAAAGAGPIPPADRARPLPASFAQERMWFLQQLDPHSPAYNVPIALRLRGALDGDALRRAMAEVVRRHQVLRTVFRDDGAGAVEQVVLPEGSFGWEEVDLSHLSPPDAESEAMRRARDEAAAPFDLERGPVLRGVLLRIGGADHLLSLCMHHVAGDAWAWEVMLRELGTLYAAFHRGVESPLPDPPLQYADYAAWQRGRLRGEVLDGQASYWRRRLRGAPAVLDLPADRPRPPVQELRGALHAFRIPADAAAKARELAAGEGATPFMVLLAAFAVVLHRWSGEDDLVVGTPVTSRPRPELEPLIGFFGNTLPLRADLSGRPSFRALVRRVRETAVDAFAHQDLPFEKLVDELGVERSLSHAPLFQVMFSLRDGSPLALALDGVSVQEVEVDSGTSRYDLTVVLSSAADGALDGFAEFATALWDEATIARMMRHLERVVRAATAHPDAPVATLPLVDEVERRLVAIEPNQTERHHGATWVHERVARQAAATPGAVAVEHAGERVTYAQLDARANRLAHRLVRLGVAPDVPVAVAMERSVEMVVAALAVLKAGGCYVAVDPAYPADRIAYMLADSGAAVVLTTSSAAPRLPATAATVVRVDAEELASEPDTPPAVHLHPDNLLYVLYTSGSTGRPKGAALPHRALANVIGWQVDRFREQATAIAARTLQFASLSFDVSFQEIFSTWATGGALVLIDDDARRDAEALLAYLREHRIERLFLPFAALQNLAEAAEGGDAHLPDLREVITAGEALRSTPQLRAFFRANPQTSLDNHYGPSETHVISAELVRGQPETWPALPPIGAPVANTRLYVLDGEMQPAPPGVPGELYAGGENLARGYLARPSLTAARFVPDPFGAPGSRLYRTSDWVRWIRRAGDGGPTLEYIGRTDFQVKIRGFRVEPGEVEAVLTEHPSVVQAAVAVRGEGAERRLAAYLVPAAGASIALPALRAHVAARLPEHMVPRAWRVMDALPLTPSGKVDRRSLPEPEAAEAEEGRAAPRTPAEEMVAEAWEAVLKVRPGAHDDFFALGGHSLAATQVVARIRRAFGIELPLRALFEAPTVAGLAARAAAARRGAHLQLPPLLPAHRGAEAPLSFAQQRFWFVERLGAAGAAYNIPLVLTLRGALDVPALRAALDALVARHEPLRTTVHLRGAEPVQVVAPPSPVDLPLHDLSGDGDARLAADRIARDEATTAFDMARGPLMRVRLLRIAPDEHQLLLTFHHAICDAWSLGVLFRDLGELYATAAEGRSARLAPPAVQYADYAIWQRERLTGDALARELAFWRQRLDGAAVLQLPTDHPRPAVQSFRGAMVPFAIGAETAARVRELARHEGATPFMVLLAAFGLLLSRWTGVEDVVVGSPVAGRVPEETEALVGVFVNTLALRADLSGQPTFTQVLARVRETTLDAYAHQEVPFERLVEALKVERSLDRHPLFQVIFSMHAGGLGAPSLPGLDVRVAEGDSETSKVDLVLAISDEGEGFDAVFQYASDLFDAATVRRMAGHLQVLLDAALADPDRPAATLPLMGTAEVAALDAFHGERAAYPRDPTLPALFAAQVARTPLATAVRWNGRETTYAELDADANRLAHRLIALGVAPEVRVAVCMERTPELIAALLAVHKAGGAYVPVDPAYPAERIAYLLADSGARVLLTHERIAARLPAMDAVTVRVDAEWPEIARGPDAEPGVSMRPENLAYVIYTSGSTGRPKGVQIEHRSAVTLVHWLREHVSDQERRAVLGSTSVSFDVSIAEIFGTLSWGGTLVLVRDPLALADTRDEVVLASMAPSAAAELLRRRAVPPSVRVLNLGGEALPNAVAQGLYELGVERVGNFYGPTEDTTYSTWSIVERGAERVHVGRPIANTRAYVLDGHLRRVPVGVPGELWLAGEGLARGYHHRPALTAERFVPDPFAVAPGARMYRVGDLVRWRADGALEYLGRLDHQVKIRGHRVETGEIEAVLADYPRVRAAAVAAREDTPGEARLVAYVVATDPGSPPAPSELREHLKARVPEYMVPAAWMEMEALPLSPNGKVDRLRLPAPGERARDAASAPPRTAAEQAVARVWREVLGLEHVGVDENFFEIGGHSLLLARLQERLNQELGCALTFVDLFQFSTIASLAEHVAASRDETQDAPPVAEAERGRGASRRELMRRARR